MTHSELRALIQPIFESQQMLHTLRARLAHISAGETELEMDFQSAFAQQHGYIHAGAITTLLDNACGCAAYTLLPPGGSVLTAEFKVNFLAPAQGEKFLAVGKVVKAGRALTVCVGEAFAISGKEKKSIALMQATMMTKR